MAGLSKYLALALFNMSLNPVRASFAPPNGLWLGLHTASPSDSTYGNEASYTSYARQPLNSLTASPQAEGANGNVDILVTNGAPLIFPVSTDTAGQTIAHWAIWDSEAAGDGNVLYSGVLTSARLIAMGDSVVVPEGSISLLIK
ncbi:hypothetical protein UFOVP653_67 [uncultured Caudovirales phage]|uniref:Uncharacterized protein n=1 Tax=uncultured Caudovirales phage TaxID=2100421 RepID=A0A6J5ND18_9CAUD|nr:hypothetical protein UFOVP653_67 [uncultured Caudovirales phage]